MGKGGHANRVLDFGVHKGKWLGSVPDSYLKWCLDQEWFESRYPQWVGPFEDELAWREEVGVSVDGEGRPKSGWRRK